MGAFEVALAAGPPGTTTAEPAPIMQATSVTATNLPLRAAIIPPISQY
jgi:hypothetical protein